MCIGSSCGTLKTNRKPNQMFHEAASPFFVFIGNLYTRQVHIEGETLAIQVQDTPGIQVRSWWGHGWLWDCPLVLKSKGHEMWGVRSRLYLWFDGLIVPGCRSALAWFSLGNWEKEKSPSCGRGQQSRGNQTNSGNWRCLLPLVLFMCLWH